MTKRCEFNETVLYIPSTIRKELLEQVLTYLNAKLTLTEELEV
jgi:hypothetical protein